MPRRTVIWHPDAAPFILARYYVNRKEPKDVSEWDGVTLDSETDDLTVIEWESMYLRGSIDVPWLLATVGKVVQLGNYLS